MQTPLIEEYNLIRAKDAPTLVKSVHAAIRDGFQPHGGASFSPEFGGMYMQAVVKYAEPDDRPT
jgi:hypothetical protein